MRRWEWWVAALLAAVVVPASPQGALHFLISLGLKLSGGHLNEGQDVIFMRQRT